MYDFTEKNLLEAKAAVKLDTPVWMDKAGNVVEEQDSFGCKVGIKITAKGRGNIIFADEVGGNTSMRKDGHAGGTKYVCSTGVVPRTKASVSDKKFSLLGFTAATGEAVMCVVIFQGKQQNMNVEMGINPFAEVDGSVRDKDFFLKNSKGENKLYPGGPTCIYKGKEVPCLVRWSESDGISGAILKECLETMDHYGIFDRSNGAVSVLIVDGH